MGGLHCYAIARILSLLRGDLQAGGFFLLPALDGAPNPLVGERVNVAVGVLLECGERLWGRAEPFRRIVINRVARSFPTHLLGKGMTHLLVNHPCPLV